MANNKKNNKVSNTKASTKKTTKKVEIKEKINNNAVNTETTNTTNNKKFRPYFSFNFRLVFISILEVIFIAALAISISKSYSIIKSEVIKYTEKSNIDYKVYLKDNDFYNTKYLDKGMAYVASLIDKININYNYKFNINTKSYIDFKYKVYAKLQIVSQNNSKIFYENEYELINENNESMRNNTNYTLDVEVPIDYDYYNSLANNFKSKYAVNTNSYLKVYLKVNELNSNNNNAYKLNEENVTILTIPLSEQEINIGLDEQIVNNDKKIVTESKFKIGENKYLLTDLVLFIAIIVLGIQLFKSLFKISDKVSDYDKYVNRILRGYDRLIVNVKTSPNLNDYNIVKVESFEELVDLRDNVKEPIRYHVITKHQKCEFFITNHNDLYLYVVKAIDLDKK